MMALPKLGVIPDILKFWLGNKEKRKKGVRKEKGGQSDFPKIGT